MIDYRKRVLGILVKALKTFLQTGAALLVVGATITAQPWGVIVATSAMAALASVISNTITLLGEVEDALDMPAEYDVELPIEVDAGES